MLKHLQLAMRTAINSFWLVPLILSFSAALLFSITYSIDSFIPGALLALRGPPFGISPDGARQLMSTIAGSLITVASLVFSMTLVALTVAAGNIGARLLLRYMQDRSIQVTLGVFLAGFIYALLSLSAVGERAEDVPHLSVFTAMLIAIMCFIWLVFAFHDLAKAIQVDQAIARLAESLRKALAQLQQSGDWIDVSTDEAVPSGYEVPACHGGYVASFNADALKAIAMRYDLQIQLLVKPGSFVLPGEPLVRVGRLAAVDVAPATAPDWEKPLADAVILTQSRHDLDDPFFCLRLLNEIAARALSPSLNDIYTALACVDHISAGVEYILRHGLPCNGWRDGDGRLRLIYSAYHFDDFIYAAFEQIRHAGIAYPVLGLRLLDRLNRLSQLAEHLGHRECLERYIDRVYQSANEALRSEADRSLLARGYDKSRRRRFD